MNRGWIGVDLDGTLAKDFAGDGGDIGDPVPLMVKRVKAWRAEGIEVRIVTARMSCHGDEVCGRIYDAVTPVQAWCLKHIGEVLPVTNAKDFNMVELWDDRAVAVEPNTGRRLSRKSKGRI